MSSLESNRGFTLVETVVATGVLVTALAGLAQLFILSAQLTRTASASSVALAAAQDRLESLRGEALSYTESGAPWTAPALAVSASSSLDEDVAANVDWLDSEGQPTPEDAAALVRRWRIVSIDDTSPDAIAIEVCVFRVEARGDHREAEACLSTIRTRQP